VKPNWGGEDKREKYTGKRGRIHKSVRARRSACNETGRDGKENTGKKSGSLTRKPWRLITRGIERGVKRGGSGQGVQKEAVTSKTERSTRPAPQRVIIRCWGKKEEICLQEGPRNTGKTQLEGTLGSETTWIR